MRTVSITAPDGTPWDVRVVWAPCWRALARRFGGWREKRSGRSGEVADGALQVGGQMPTPSDGGGGGDDGGGLGDEIVDLLRHGLRAEVVPGPIQH
ncbi:hypothetical protein ACQP2E_15365 [Actinoplanes sp. CA-015351]|uniref:hypothetical protein n=1 Tax=Actinoplanes sp. CA-015351 TaxID=3239897 RepID=UPI003D956CFC